MRSLLIVVLLAASNCFLHAQASSPATHDDLKSKIVAMEREELDCLKTGDLKHFAEVIADEAIFLDPHGSATKREVVQNVADVKLTDYQIDDVSFVLLSEHSGLIAYRLKQKGSAHGREFANEVFVSAVWAERHGKWVSLFSQETPARGGSGM